MSPLVYGSVCSGIEAASVAWHPLGWRCAFVSEIEPFPRAVLAHRWPDTPLHGDFTTIEAGQYEPIDLLVGGTPCQSFSVAGLRGGLADERGNLALQFLRLAQRLRPRWVVWENVPGVLSSTSHDAPDPCLPPDGMEEGAEWVGEDEYDADESHAFSCFLAGLSELGYGWAYRSLDAQYAGLAQRRERVFVVGCLGDWRRACAVLFERHSLSGHPAPRREAGQGVTGTLKSCAGSGGWSNSADHAAAGLMLPDIAPTIPSRPTGGGGLGTDFDCDGGLIPDVAVSLTRHDQSRPESGAVTLITEVAHALRADGFDASEDGTGRGTPLVPTVAPCLTQNYGKQPDNSDTGAGPMLVAFDTTQITSDKNYSRPRAGDPCHPLAAGAHPPAVAFNWQSGGDVRLNVTAERTDALHASQTPAVMQGVDTYNAALDGDVAHTIPSGAGPGRAEHALAHMAVRRLTPRECERLQGFPDDYTLVPYRGKPAADGPRYKALGNSMAVPCMAWIGERIALVESLTAAERVA